MTIIERPKEPVAPPKVHHMIVKGLLKDKVEWTTDDLESVKLAEKTFDNAVEKGYKGFNTSGSQSGGDQMEAFDQEVEEIYMVPRLAGG